MQGLIRPRYLAALVLGIGIWAGLLLAFIWIIDPYGVSPTHVTIAGINKFKPERNDIDRLLKPYEVLIRQPKTVFLGTSRIHQAFDPSVLDGTSYAPAYNAAVPGGTVAENIAFLKEYITTDSRLKHVFFEVFLYAFLEPMNNLGNKGLLDILETLPQLHFSQSTIRSAFRTLHYNLTSTSPPTSITQGGFATNAHNFDPSMYFVAQNFAQFVLDANRKVGVLKFNESTLEALNEAQEFCDVHGVDITFLVAPDYPWDDYRLISTGDWPLVRQLYTHLANLRHVYSFAQINDLTAEPVSPTMKYWNDYFHFSLAMGAEMERALVGSNGEMPQNFMIKINRDTLETSLAMRRDGMEHWINQNRDFESIFDDTKIAMERDGNSSGILDIEGQTLTVDGVTHVIVPEKSGVVQTVVRYPDYMMISGWAADTVNRIPALNIVGTVGANVVSKWFPGTPRLDNEATYGRGIRPSNFVMRMNGTPPAPEFIRVFAIMKDGRASQLLSTNPLVTGPAVIGATAVGANSATRPPSANPK